MFMKIYYEGIVHHNDISDHTIHTAIPMNVIKYTYTMCSAMTFPHQWCLFGETGSLAVMAMPGRLARESHWLLRCFQRSVWDERGLAMCSAVGRELFKRTDVLIVCEQEV